jgi:hypothetical protein
MAVWYFLEKAKHMEVMWSKIQSVWGMVQFLPVHGMGLRQCKTHGD